MLRVSRIRHSIEIPLKHGGGRGEGVDINRISHKNAMHRPRVDQIGMRIAGKLDQHIHSFHNANSDNLNDFEKADVSDSSVDPMVPIIFGIYEQFWLFWWTFPHPNSCEHCGVHES